MPTDWVPPCSWQPIMQFINDQYEKYLQEEVNINRKKRIPDTRVHCCLYFIPATGHSYVPPARSGAAARVPPPSLWPPHCVPPTSHHPACPGGRRSGWARGGPEPGLCLLRAGILAGLAGGQRLSSCVSLALTCPSVWVASP